MIEAALPLTTASDIRSISHRVSRLSPVWAEILLPSPFKKIAVDDPRTPDVSIATGSNMYLSTRLEYLALLSRSARSAAAPGLEAVAPTADEQKVSTHVASQLKHLPWLYANMVIPSGLVLSRLLVSVGSRREGMPAAARPRFTTSLMFA